GEALRPGGQPLPLGGAARRRRRLVTLSLHLGFAEVGAVRHADMPLSEPDRILGLLAIEIDDAEGGGVIVRLRFADGRMIRLEALRLLCHLEDVGEPWPTRFRPDHPLADSPS
ncbi:MAG: DUF2948 family protein, partial [Reyranellaceae bacterium]